jgi:Xaa-Pro dipeptidase
MIDLERRQRVQSALEPSGLDAVIGARAEELVLLTAHASHLGLSLAVQVRDAAPILYVPTAEPEETLEAALNGGVTVRRLEPADLEAALRDDLSRLGVGCVGVAEWSARTATFGSAAEGSGLNLQDLLRGFERRDAAAMLARLMRRKTPLEVARLRKTQTVAAFGLRAFQDALAVGATEAAVAGCIEAAVHARTGRDGVHQARAWASVQSGERTRLAGAQSRSSGRALRAGDLVVLELATCADGYWSDLTRTAVVGTPSPEQTRLLEAIRAAQRAALRALRPGATHAAVDAAARAVMTERGFGAAFAHATGHHVGFRYHDPGPNLEPGVEVTLEPGMVVTIEPGAYGAFGGARIEDNALVTETGCEWLSMAEVSA